MDYKLKPLTNLNNEEAKLFFDLMLKRNEFTHLANYGKSLINFIEGRYEKSEEYLQKAVTQGLTSAESRIDEMMTKTTEVLKKKEPPVVNILEVLSKTFDDIEFNPFIYNFTTLTEFPKTTCVSLNKPESRPVPFATTPTSARTPTNGRRDFYCIICDKEFTKMFSLNRHMMIHAGTKSHQCNLCKRAFIQKSDLQRHIESHKATYDIKCTFIDCDRRFKTKKNMKSHIISHFPQIRDLKCKHCDQTFNRRQSLKLHEANHEDKEIQCDICGKYFVCKPYIRSHMRVHMEGKPFECPVCKLRFKRNFDMTFHFRRQHI